MKSILVHPMSGLLSAYGMGLADIRATRQKALGVRARRQGAFGACGAWAENWQVECLGELEAQGIARDEIRTHRSRPYPLCRHRYGRWPSMRPSPRMTTSPRLRAEFETLHKRRFGFVADNKALVIDAVEVETVGGGAAQMEGEGLRDDGRRAQRSAAAPASIPRASATMRRWLLRAEIKPGQRLDGPAIIIEPNQTIIVEDGWQAELTAKDHIVLRRVKALPAAQRDRHQGRSGHARRFSTISSCRSPSRWA